MKTSNIILSVLGAFTVLCVTSSCRWDEPYLPLGTNPGDTTFNTIDTTNNPGITCPNYPDDVETILVNKCATAGCHNSVSYVAASGLDLTSWKTMRRGNVAGAVVVPGNPDYSTLFSFCNTYNDLGFTGNEPKMPLNSSALTRDEITTLKNWITNGARNRCGDLMFPNNQGTSKLYISNQACDQVVAIDPDTRLIRSWFDVGNTPVTESPHMMGISPDGQYIYVSLYSKYLQRYRTVDNSFVDQVNLDITSASGLEEAGQWGTIAISADGKKAYSVDYSLKRIASINLENFPLTAYVSLPLPALGRPHGVALNQQDTKLYITNQDGTNFSIMDTASTFINFAIASQNMLTIPMGGIGKNGHEIIFTTDYSKYMITCDASNEVRVFNTSDNSLHTAIPVGTFPQEFTISKTRPYLFVSCTEDAIGNERGSIAVIDLNTFTLLKKIHTGTQPHGLAVDDARGIVYVANRNVDPSGDAPHHSGSCAGRNGYLTLIDMATLEMVPGYKCELGVNPYSVVLKN